MSEKVEWNKSKEPEEITDMMADKAYVAKDEDGEFVFHEGKVLKFNFEGSITTLKITKIDRKNKRMWAEHVELVNQVVVRSHYGHNVDSTEEAMKEYGVPFCTDCQVPVNEESTEDGEVKALERAENTLSDGTIIE
jgi:hypothetical protein